MSLTPRDEEIKESQGLHDDGYDQGLWRIHLSQIFKTILIIDAIPVLATLAGIFYGANHLVQGTASTILTFIASSLDGCNQKIIRIYFSESQDSKLGEKLKEGSDDKGKARANRAKLVEEASISGLRVAEWCRQKTINEKTFLR